MTSEGRNDQVTVPRFLAVASAYSWRFLVLIAAVAVVVYILVTLRLIVLPVLVALLLATLLVPPANRLRSAGVPSLLATWIVLLVSIGAFVALFYVLAPIVVQELDDIGTEVRQGTEEVLTWLSEGPLDVSRSDVDRYVDQAVTQLGENRERIVAGAFRGAYVLVEVVAGFILTLVLVFFFVKDGDRLSRGALRLFAESRRDDVRALAQRSWNVLGAYVRGIAVVGVVDALLIGLALVIVGVPLALPLAIITFFAAFFPLVGAVIAGILATLVALVTKGAIAAAIIAAVTIVVQQVEGDVLQPVVMGKALQLHPLVILLSLTAGAIVAGVAGAFLGVPLAAVASTALRYVRSKETSPAVDVSG